MATGATFEGVEQLRDSLGVAAQQLQDLSTPSTQAAAVVDQALSQQAPKRTGHLADSFATVVDASGFTVTSAADYAAPVNALDPFKARALDATTNQVIEIYSNAVVEIVDKIKGI